MNLKFFAAVFLQFTGIVGAGIFVLPYTFYHSNLYLSLIFLVLLTVVASLLHRSYIDIILSTKGDHQLAGYARIHLGPRFYWLAVLNLLLLSAGAVIAYQKLFVSFLATVFPGIGSTISAIIFIDLIFFSQYLRLYKSKRSFFVPTLMILVPLFLLLFAFYTNSYPLPPVSSAPSFAFYGSLIFALSGFTILPEVEEIVRGTRLHSRLRLISLLGQILASLVYFVFVFAVVRLSGPNITPNSITGIIQNHPILGTATSLLGAIIVFRAAQNFQAIINEIFHRDLNFSTQTSSVFSFLFYLLPLVVTSTSLLAVISLTGSITIFISALIICLIRLRLRHTFATDFQTVLVLLSFTAGLIYTLFF